MRVFHFALGFLFLSTPLFSDVPEPYNSLDRVLPLDMHGWFAPENRENLQRMIRFHKPKVIVELGTWLGLSAIHLANWADEDAVLYAVDHFQGNPGAINEPTSRSKLPVLYEQFLSNVIHHHLTHKIIPMKMSTLEAAEQLNVEIDFIYVDASHDFPSVYSDIMTWYPKLSPTGIMCGDDYLGPGVQKAVKKAAAELGVAYFSDRNFWWFQ